MYVAPRLVLLLLCWAVLTIEGKDGDKNSVAKQAKKLAKAAVVNKALGKTHKKGFGIMKLIFSIIGLLVVGILVFWLLRRFTSCFGGNNSTNGSIFSNIKNRLNPNPGHSVNV